MREREREKEKERELDAALDKAFPKSCKFQNKKGMWALTLTPETEKRKQKNFLMKHWRDNDQNEKHLTQ